MKILRGRLCYVATIYVHFVVVDNSGMAQPSLGARGSVNIYKKFPPQAVIATYRTESLAHGVAVPQVSGGQERGDVRQNLIRKRVNKRHLGSMLLVESRSLYYRVKNTERGPAVEEPERGDEGKRGRGRGRTKLREKLSVVCGLAEIGRAHV